MLKLDRDHLRRVAAQRHPVRGRNDLQVFDLAFGCPQPLVEDLRQRLSCHKHFAMRNPCQLRVAQWCSLSLRDQRRGEVVKMKIHPRVGAVRVRQNPDV